jgi:hypothetical protein
MAFNVNLTSDVHLSDIPFAITPYTQSTAGPSHSTGSKKQADSHCASCRNYNCDKAADYAERDGCKLCKCTDNPVTKNP